MQEVCVILLSEKTLQWDSFATFKIHHKFKWGRFHYASIECLG